MPNATARIVAFLLALVFSLFPGRDVSGQACEGVRTRRVALLTTGFAAANTGAVLARHDDWWTTPRTSFHAVWDASPSKGQDRLLHATIAYHISRLSAAAWDWTCVSPVTAGWLGAVFGVVVGLPKEIGDGLHTEKGFSIPDALWSTGGAVLPALHRTLRATRAVTLKFTYWPSDELRNRTGPLPSLENDYAGQRYYAVLNPRRATETFPFWPEWLGLAVGHGVPHWVTVPPTHEWYVTLDVALERLLRGRVPSVVTALFEPLHMPAPGLRLRDGGVSLGFY